MRQGSGDKKNGNHFSYSWGVKLTLMSGEALRATGCELAGQPTMVNPVAFRFMAPCSSALAQGCSCGGAAEGDGAWKPLPGAAWEIGVAAVRTGWGAVRAGSAGIADACCCRFILL